MGDVPEWLLPSKKTTEGMGDVPEWLLPSKKTTEGIRNMEKNMNLEDILKWNWISIYDSENLLQLSLKEVEEISSKISILKELHQIWLNLNRLDHIKYISSLSDEVIQWLMEWDKLKKILSSWIRVDTFIYNWTNKDLLEISKISLQHVDSFINNKNILQLKKDWYYFNAKDILIPLPTEKEYSILKIWFEFSNDWIIPYGFNISNLRESWITLEWLQKIVTFSTKYNINFNDFFWIFDLNLKLIKILSDLDESVLKHFFRKWWFERIKGDLFSPKNWEQIQQLAQLSDVKIDLLLRLRDSWVFPKEYKYWELSFQLDDYVHVNEVELQHLLNISDVSVQKNILIELKGIKSRSSDFIFNWEQSVENLSLSYEKYLTSKHMTSVPVDSFQWASDWKKFVDKMFRTGDYGDSGTIHVTTTQWSIARQWRGFYMNQTIWDCYLIAAINAMRQNPHFVQDLYRNLKYNKDKNPLKSTYWYTFPDGEYIEVSLKDLRTEIKKGKSDPVSFLDNLVKNDSEMDDLIIDLLQKIERRWMATDRWVVQWWEIEIPYIDLQQYVIEINGIKRLKFPEALLQEVKNQIKQKKGSYYDLAISHIKQDRKMKSVDAPLWYKILEALYAKKYWNTKVGIEWGMSSWVMESFLPREGWKNITNEFYWQMSLKSQGNQIYVEHIFNNYNTWNYIMTTWAKWVKNDGISAYFSYWENDMASWHAYSVVWYDKLKKIVHVVNPWDNTKIIDMPIDDFFRVFDDVSISEKIDMTQTSKVTIPIESVKKPKIHNMESILHETWLDKTQFQQLFWMHWAKTQDINFLDDGRINIKIRDATDTYYSLIFDPNLKTYKYISAENPPNMDFLTMQQYYARQIWVKNIDFRTQTLLWNPKSFDYLFDMFQLWFRYQDNNINEILFASFSDYIKKNVWESMKRFTNFDEMIHSLEGRRIFLDFIKNLEAKGDFAFFRYDLQKKIT